MVKSFSAQGNIEKFEHQLQTDLGICLGTDLSRVEIVGSEPRKQVPLPHFYGALSHNAACSSRATLHVVLMNRAKAFGRGS